MAHYDRRIKKLEPVYLRRWSLEQYQKYEVCVDKIVNSRKLFDKLSKKRTSRYGIVMRTSLQQKSANATVGRPGII